MEPLWKPCPGVSPIHYFERGAGPGDEVPCRVIEPMRGIFAKHVTGQVGTTGNRQRGIAFCWFPNLKCDPITLSPSKSRHVKLQRKDFWFISFTRKSKVSKQFCLILVAKDIITDGF